MPVSRNDIISLLYHSATINTFYSVD